MEPTSKVLRSMRSCGKLFCDDDGGVSLTRISWSDFPAEVHIEPQNHWGCRGQKSSSRVNSQVPWDFFAGVYRAELGGMASDHDLHAFTGWDKLNHPTPWNSWHVKPTLSVQILLFLCEFCYNKLQNHCQRTRRSGF